MDAHTLPTDLPACGMPATTRIEIYSPANGYAHGSLDGALYTCAEHTQPAAGALQTAGFTPYRLGGGKARRCGDGFDINVGLLHAPVPQWREACSGP